MVFLLLTLFVLPAWRIAAQEPEPISAPNQGPAITGLSPGSGPLLSLVTISGGPFSANPAENAVSMGGVAAPSRTLSVAQIEFLVPENAPAGTSPVVVSTRGLFSGPASFTVTSPATPDTVASFGYNSDITAFTFLGISIRSLSLQARTTVGDDLTFPFPGNLTAARGIFPTPFFPGLNLPPAAPGSSGSPLSLYATPIPGRVAAGRDQLTSDLASATAPAQVYSATSGGLSSFANSFANFQSLPAGAGVPIHPPVFAPNPLYNARLANDRLLNGDVFILTTTGVVDYGGGTSRFIPFPPNAGDPVGPPVVQRNAQFDTSPGGVGSPQPFLDGLLISTTRGLVTVSAGFATLLPFPSQAGQPVGSPVYRASSSFNPLTVSGGPLTGDSLPNRSEILVATANGLVSIVGGLASFTGFPTIAGRTISQPVDQLNSNFNLFSGGSAPPSDASLFSGATLLSTENGLIIAADGSVSFVPVPVSAGRVIGSPMNAPNPDFNPYFPVIPTGSPRPFSSSIMMATANGLVIVNGLTANFVPGPLEAGQVVSPPAFQINTLFNPSFNPASPVGVMQPFASAVHLATTNGLLKVDGGVATFTSLPLGAGMPISAPIPITTPQSSTQAILALSNGLAIFGPGGPSFIPLPAGSGRVVGPPLRTSLGQWILACAGGVLQVDGTAGNFFPSPSGAGEIVSTPINDPAPGASLAFLLTTANGFLRFSNGGFGYFPLPGNSGRHISPRMALASLTVVQQPPIANPGPDRTVSEGTNITFDGSGSFAPNGTIVSYQWDFGDGSTGAGQFVNHTFADNGLYTVRLTVTDSNGLSGTGIATITVFNVPPAVNAGPDQTASVGSVVSFNGSFTDPGTRDTFVTRWDFGDGGSITGTLTPTHAYSSVGLFTVTLTVTDKDLGAGIGTMRVNVVDTTPPQVNVIAPVNGETIPAGSTYNIRWTSTDNLGVTTQDILLAIDGFNFNTTIASGLSGFTQQFNWPVPGTLNTGSARIRIIARDAAGNAGQGESGVFSIRDAQPPSVTLQAPVGGETIAAGSQFLIRWISSDNIGVVSHDILFASDGFNFNTTVASGLSGATQQFTWSVPGNLFTSSARIRIIARDAAGNAGQSDSGAFTIRDTVPPTVSIQAPAGGESLTPGTTFLVRWNSFDNVGVTSHDLSLATDGFNFNTPITSGLPGSTQQFNWSIPQNLVTNNARIRIVARDAAGNAGQSDSGLFTIRDTIPPSVTITAPLSGQTLSAGSSFTIRYDSSDNVGVVAHDISLSIDGGFNFSNAIASGLGGNQKTFNWSVPNNLATNSAVLRVIARDAAGNVGQANSGSFSIRDTQPPSVNVTSPSNGQTVNPGSVFMITWTSSDNVGVSSHDILFSTNGGGNFNTTIVSGLGGGQQSFNWSVPSNVNTTQARLRVIARDAAGNQGSDDTGNFTIRDNVPPTVNVIAPAAGQTVSPNSQFTISWNSSDNIGVTSQDIQFSSNGGQTFATVASNLGGAQQQFTWTVPNINTMQARIRVIARDAAGNQGQGDTGNFSIRDNVPPTVNVVAPTTGQSVSPGSNFSIQWNSSDNIGVSSHDVLLSTNGGNNFSNIVTGLPGNQQQFSWSVPNNINTTQARIRVVAHDAAGNTGVGETGNFSIRDTVAPTVSIVAPVGGETLSQGGSFTIRWSSSDNTGVDSHDLLLSTNGGGSFPININLGLSGNQQSFNWTVPNIISTTQAQVRVVARDAAGNVGQATSGNFTIRDTVSPSVNVTQPAAGATVTAGSPFTIRWTSSDNVAVASHEILLSTNGGSTFPTNIMTNLSGGLQQFSWNVPAISTTQGVVRVIARDAAGNMGQDNSGVFTIQQPNVPPTVTVVSPNGGETILAGSTFNIQWTSSDSSPIASHEIQLSTNGGGSFNTTIQTGLPGSAQSFSWSVPVGLSTTRGRIRVIARDTGGLPGQDDSNADFTVQAAGGGGGQFALVASSRVTVLQGLPSSGSILRQFSTNLAARELAVAPNGQAGVVIGDGQRVSVITGVNTGNPSEVTSFDLDGTPGGVAITDDSSIAVVLVNTTPAALVPILGLSTSNPSLGTTFPLNAVGPGQDIVLTRSGTAVITSASIGGVAVVDGFRASSMPSFRGIVRTGTNPSGVAVSLDGTTAFVVNQSNNNIVVVTGLAPGGQLNRGATITNNVGMSPRAIRISSDGALAVVTNQGGNSASIFNVGSGTLSHLKMVNVGSQPAGVSIARDGNSAIVANSGDQTVSVITNLRVNPSVTSTIGPSSQLQTSADREQSVAYVP